MSSLERFTRSLAAIVPIHVNPFIKQISGDTRRTIGFMRLYPVLQNTFIQKALELLPGLWLFVFIRPF